MLFLPFFFGGGMSDLTSPSPFPLIRPTSTAPSTFAPAPAPLDTSASALTVDSAAAFSAFVSLFLFGVGVDVGVDVILVEAFPALLGVVAPLAPVSASVSCSRTSALTASEGSSSSVEIKPSSPIPPSPSFSTSESSIGFPSSSSRPVSLVFLNPRQSLLGLDPQVKSQIRK